MPLAHTPLRTSCYEKNRNKTQGRDRGSIAGVANALETCRNARENDAAASEGDLLGIDARVCSFESPIAWQRCLRLAPCNCGEATRLA
eukprot:scaffold908_cov228-Pinguiococcus_pyrenoidosus.AAC.8